MPTIHPEYPNLHPEEHLILGDFLFRVSFLPTLVILCFSLFCSMGCQQKYFNRNNNSQVYINKINDLCDIGVVQKETSSLRITAAGRPILNAVLRKLLED